MLKDHAYPLANLTDFSLVGPIDVVSVKKYFTLRCIDKPVDATQDRRFAGTGRPDDRYEFAFVYRKGNIGQRPCHFVVCFAYILKN
jgi:hypothetical protein